jgi:tRNA(Ile)-lysidine synthase
MKNLTRQFTDYNHHNRLASQSKRTLLAVSGGMDSVVMCHLFKEAGFPFAIAHCNFQLRGEEANGDEQSVKQLAEKLEVPFFTIRFNTKEYAEQNKISIQVAARNLRYEWFEKIRKENNCRLIATAHQHNDNIETALFNFIKGSGVRGLRGIPVRQGNIIRPILFATRTQIEQYVKDNNLTYREDSSNAETKYTRNKIRHELIPLIETINPAFEKTFAEKLDILTELEELYTSRNGRQAKQLFLQRKDDVYIPILKLKKTKHASTVLYEYLKEYDYTIEQVYDMLANLDDTPGKQFVTAKARIIKDRKFFILSLNTNKQFTTAIINEGDKAVNLGDKELAIEELSKEGLKIKPDAAFAYLDKSKLEFPLIIRHWKQGDYFYPFGMGMKKKKVSKFFKDIKMPLHQKETVWVLESNKKIAWVAGHRLDERFKVTDKTTAVVQIKIK